MLTDNLGPLEDYLFVEIQIFPSSTARIYTARLSASDGPDISASLVLDQDRLTALDADPKAYGLALGRELFADNVLGHAYREAFAVAQRNGKGLRVRLRLDAPDLHAIHWERIYYPLNASWHPLGDSADTPFSRNVPPSWKSPQLITERPVKILAVISSPANLDPYKLDPIPASERLALHTALDALPNVLVTYLETGTSNRPTLSQLRKTLAYGYHLVHFLCHGAVIKNGSTVLYLEDELGNVAYATTDGLVGLIKDLRDPPVFCFLAACESAAHAASDAFAPLGPTLAQHGNLQAVVAMTHRVGMETAKRFTAQFYIRLLHHGIVDVAVNEARSLVQDKWDWGAPVLFMSLDDGQLFDYRFNDIRWSWFKREVELRERIFRDELSEHFDGIASPLFDYWDNFMRAPGWHEELAGHLEELHKNASKFPNLASLAHSLTQVDCNDNYDGILASLRQLLDDHAVAVSDVVAYLRKISEQPIQQNADEINLLPDAEDLLNEMRYLERQTKDPNFRRCFLFMGSLGTGKTHFIASLLATRLTQNKTFLLLKLSLSSDKPLDEQILQEINKATGKVWSGLKEFNTFLEAEQKARLVIALDDLQKWLSSTQPLRNLIDVISAHTDLHSIYWLIALEDASYDKVAGKSENHFWQIYSYQADEQQHAGAKDQKQPISIGGWLYLDELNSSKRVGLKLLQQKLSPKKEIDLQALQTLDEKAEATRYLSSPFIAWILWDLREELPLSRVVNLNFIELMDYYWKKLRSAINPAPLSLQQIQQCILLIAEFLAQSANLTPNRTLLLNRIHKAAIDRFELQERGLAESALEVLERGPLLARKKPDTETKIFLEDLTEIRFEPFWEYQLASQLQRETVQKRSAEEVWFKIESWFRSPHPESIKQGVFEFLLLLLDQYTNHNSSYFIDNILHLGSDAQFSLTSAMWFAGPKLSIEKQRSLVALAETPKIYSNSRDLFAFMYFVCESAPKVLDLPRRLTLLQPHYKAIQDASLANYYLYIVRRLFVKQEDNNVILACMTCFPGCEVMDIMPNQPITPLLTELTIATLARNVQDEMNDLLDIILEYLRVDYEKNKSTYENNRNATSRSRYFYRQWLLCEFCRTFVNIERLSSYYLLSKHHWYRAQMLQIGYPTSLEMRQEANLALGAWYRNRARKEERESYFKLIEKLTNSSASEDRTTAFFLIRHTEITEGRRGVQVDKVFHSILRKLFLDSKLQKLTESYFADFQANLEDIDRLAQQRRLHTTSHKAPLNQNRRMKLAMDYVWKKGFINTAKYRKLTGVSEDVAHQDLGLLVTQGFLKRTGKKRNQGYMMP